MQKTYWPIIVALLLGIAGGVSGTVLYFNRSSISIDEYRKQIGTLENQVEELRVTNQSLGISLSRAESTVGELRTALESLATESERNAQRAINTENRARGIENRIGEINAQLAASIVENRELRTRLDSSDGILQDIGNSIRADYESIDDIIAVLRSIASRLASRGP